LFPHNIIGHQVITIDHKITDTYTQHQQAKATANVAALEVILHLRQQVVDVIEQLNHFEERLSNREQELLGEIQTLSSRLAEEVDWYADDES
jgi:hypothetical protein